MKSFTYTISDPIGIHARPAGVLVKRASAFESDITLECGGKSADAKRIFAVMGLGVKSGDEVTLTASGADEDSAIDAMKELFAANH